MGIEDALKGINPAGKMKELSFFKNGINQVALVVKSVDETAEQFNRLFGVGPWTFYTFAPDIVKETQYHGQVVQCKHRVAFGQVGNVRFELIEEHQGPTLYGDFVKEHGYGLHHIGVLVDDMAAALAEAEAAGIAVLQQGYGFGLAGEKDGHYAYLDTEKELGLILELIQIPRQRRPAEKIIPAEG